MDIPGLNHQSRSICYFFRYIKVGLNGVCMIVSALTIVVILKYDCTFTSEKHVILFHTMLRRNNL